jgi:hypothetical protein
MPRQRKPLMQRRRLRPETRDHPQPAPNRAVTAHRRISSHELTFAAPVVPSHSPNRGTTYKHVTMSAAAAEFAFICTWWNKASDVPPAASVSKPPRSGRLPADSHSTWLLNLDSGAKNNIINDWLQKLQRTARYEQRTHRLGECTHRSCQPSCCKADAR